MRKKLLIAFVFLGAFLGYSQGESTYWYFGNGAGLRFNEDGSTTALTDGKLSTLEGCASISDQEGNLLLYTDGRTVYNANHDVIANGTGLYGDSSSSQSALIVPKPEDPSIQYIFTVDTSTNESDSNFGFNYSEVDLESNGGQGYVRRKNINLLDFSSEKITAVLKDCSNRSVWVVTLAPSGNDDFYLNTFYAYEVGPNGINSTPVTSSFPEFQITDPRGYLKFSPDGTKVACANSMSGLYLFDFDVATGTVSNPLRISIPGENRFPYGVEFSQNQQFLYVNASNNASREEDETYSSSLFQFDLSTYQTVELDRRETFRSALQLGYNGKIYRTIAEEYLTGTKFLGVIHNPNEGGPTANYQHNAISLEGKIGNQGLPPFIQSFFFKAGLFRNEDGTQESSASICETEELRLGVDFSSGATYIWKKNGVLLPNASHELVIPSAGLTDSGEYSLEIIPADPKECVINGEAIIEIIPIPIPNPVNLVQCDVDMVNSTDGLTGINLEQISTNSGFTYTFYESISDLTNDLPISDPVRYQNTNPFSQTVYYRVVNERNCGGSSEINLSVVSTAIGSSTPKTFYGCDDNPEDDILEGTFDLDQIRQAFPGLEVSFYETREDAGLELNALPANYESQPETIFARLENNNECQNVEEIELILNPSPSFTYPEEFNWCTNGEPLDLNAPLGFDLYNWYYKDDSGLVPLESGSSISVEQAGDFVLEIGYSYVQNNQTTNCFTTKEFTIFPSSPATFVSIDITDFSENNTVMVIVEGDGDYEYSLDGLVYQDDQLFEDVIAGFRTVYVNDKNGCGVSEKQISILGYPKFFTPNGDNEHDTWQLLGADDQVQAMSLISIYDRFGTLITQISPKSDGWDGCNSSGGELPSSSYWFKANLEDGRVFKGYFALKR
nr:T9SS type B sorting domain-containing protein [uncultured Allomuricauda sp.]